MRVLKWGRPDWQRGLRVVRLMASHLNSRDIVFQSAAIAFFSLFSMAPLLIVAVAIAGVVFGEAAVEGQVIGQLSAWTGPETAGLVQSALVSARPQEAGILPSLVGILAILFGASTVFVQIRYALNSIWGVEPRPDRNSFLLFVRRRLLALVMVLSVGVVLLLSLVTGLLLQTFYRFAGQWLIEPPGTLWFWVETGASFLVLTLAFALVQKLASDVRVSGWALWPGAVCGALLFTLGRYALAQYLTVVSIGSAYGAAGTLIISLIWLQYSAASLLVGVALNQALTAVAGRPVRPVAAASHRPGMAPGKPDPMDTNKQIN